MTQFFFFHNKTLIELQIKVQYILEYFYKAHLLKFPPYLSNPLKQRGTCNHSIQVILRTQCQIIVLFNC